eukprot:CAMPEP_0168617554 /NCGR_PEP_ID=MMETSP0449_2-20121227/5601_1 /TAXON_ID=1082188 /ORGANISM="Strombidium rassoulzadegani, Strain ras09" /LENGTH=207 /DNA_ID=CAMNT_0008658371 /DNA_START=774 /DNA_END=1393 /DNA_ORIENTATION=+
MLWGLLFVLKGILSNFFGRKSIKPTVFVISFFVSSLTLLLFIYSLFVNKKTAEWLNWAILIFCATVGLFAAYLLIKYLKYGIALLGGSAGAALGFLVCSTFQIKHASIFWSAVACLALVMALLTFKKREHVMILSTCVLGSYLIVRGVSLYAGGFPNEFEFTKEFDSGAWTSLPWTFYVYLVMMVVMFVLGTYYQYLQYKNEAPSKR